MENENQKPKILKSVIIIVLFIGALLAYQGYYKNNNQEAVNKEDTSKTETLTNCGLTVNVPKDIKGGKFRIEAILDNNNREQLGCSWVAFEAQTGVVFVKDGAGNDVATPTPLATVMEWMTEDPVLYFADINVLNGYTGDAIVIINEENPSDEAISKTISFPINIK